MEKWDTILKRRDSIKNTNALRLLHRGEGPLECTVDYYAGYMCVWLYHEKDSLLFAQEQLAPFFAEIEKNYPLYGGVFKRANKNPHDQKLITEEKTWGQNIPSPLMVTENEILFNIMLTQNQHTGLFLDQRDNRSFVKNNSFHKKVANLFSYTCSFSLAAALGGATEVFSVDVSQPSLNWGRDNFKLNGLDDTKFNFVKKDVREWLKFQVKKNNMFDLIICDPPTFSKTKSGGFFSVEKEWKELVKDCSQILNKNGQGLFCTNHQAGKKENYHSILKKHFKTVEVLRPPSDFPATALETVQMYWCVK
ncbi:class I SAM-dependent methyltransferase [bacterium]|nr:class I SAM-dependent methyltransferase [bacterium]